ncbi:MAG: hypothetical protein ABSG33_06045 [Candidatus Bathyarchaeia archaeon]|jgi:hypothetical protein
MKTMKMRKLAVFVVLFLVTSGVFAVVRSASAQATLPTILIQPDGAVSPASEPIQRSGNTYTFTGNVYGAIDILRSNVVLDGAGYTLSGSFSGNSTDIWVVGTGPNPNTLDYYTIGVDLGNKSVDGVTIENLNVENFSIGMYVWTRNNTVDGNAISGCIVGLLMSGSNSTITGNYLTGNIEALFFGFNAPSGQFPPDMVVYDNAFVKNNVQISGCQCKAYNLSETPHYWDNGKVGNYWSNYNGTSSNHDGIGTTPYVIDVLDEDRFPLMQIPVKPPVPASKQPLPLEAIAVAVLVPVALAGAAVVAFKQSRKSRLREPAKNYDSSLSLNAKTVMACLNKAIKSQSNTREEGRT